MEYIKLVKVYEALEKTTKRLEKTDIISEFIKNVKEDELQHLIYLIEGRVFPESMEEKIGMSSQLILKVIARASGDSIKKIEDEWRKKGDLGIVAEESIKEKKQRTLGSRDLTTQLVYNNIKKLAEIEGQGTVDRKVSLISELLSNARPEEARFIVRTVLEELRIGVSEGIVRDSIAKAFDIPVDDVEKSFNLLVDFGKIAVLAKKGKSHLNKVGLEPRRATKVMLAILVNSVSEGFEYLGKPLQAEIKLDGFRCVTGSTPIYVFDKGLTSIKNIKRGDFVLTHTGKFKEVEAVNERIINKKEELFEFQSFFGDRFRITGDHKILVYKNDKSSWIEIKKIDLKKDWLIIPKAKINTKSILKEYLELKDDSGYYKRIKINDFFFRFLGFWVGDGFTNDYHNTERVGLLFNKKTEKILCDHYKRRIIKNFKIKNVSVSIYKNMISLYFRDKPFRIWLSQHFRREWKGKRLPNWFLGINERQFNNFIQGYLESDGHCDELGRKRITTKERDIATTIQLLGLKFGKVFGFGRFNIKIKNHRRMYYKITIPKSNRHYKIMGSKILVRISKLNRIKYPDPRINLYNLQVKKDRSYCSSLVSLHNCMIHNDGKNISLFTRRMENVTNQFKELVPIIKKYIKADSYIIDTELVGYDPKTKKYLPFQSISQRIKRKYDIEEMAKKFPVEINAFDIIYYNGDSIAGKKLKERREILEKIVDEKKLSIVLTKKLVSSDEKAVNKFFKDSIKNGFEGIMLKNLSAEYKPGRYVNYMCKMKQTLEPLDLVIVGAQWGEGKRSDWLSSFTIACRKDENFVEIGKVGTGIKEKAEGVSFKDLTKMLKPLIKETKGKNVFVKPKIIIEVGYEEIQKSPTYESGYALRFPKLLMLRTEKPLSEVSSIKEIERIYKYQKGKKK